MSHDSVFAFVKFEDARAAANAAYSRDGYYYYGYRLVVEKWTSGELEKWRSGEVEKWGSGVAE